MDLFNQSDKIIVINNKPEYIQRILDYDYMVDREPSVVAIVGSEDGYQKLFYGSNEILIPIYKDINKALNHRPTVAINLSSFRSVKNTTIPLLEDENIRVIVIVAEGVPERDMKDIISKNKNKIIIGPATFGAISPRKLRAGVIGGDENNIIKSKLYNIGSIGVVTRSGGLLNEVFRIIAKESDGVYEGIAIGGEVFPGSTLIDHIERMNKNPNIKFIVSVSEIGGTDEYKIAELYKEKILTKPLIMWVTGAVAEIFPQNAQFGHAAARISKDEEKAFNKMHALKEAGVIVPNSFSEIALEVRKLVKKMNISIEPKYGYNQIPLTFNKNFRRPASIVSSISKEIDGEIAYNGKKITDIISNQEGIGKVIGYLWFKKDIPKRLEKFLELVIVVLADHGPNVSGAHNAIVASRAGKDIISSLASGLLTIGPRFGGAIDDAMRNWRYAVKNNISAKDFISMYKIIPGIGHRVKSKFNPDKRVEIIKSYITGIHMNFALEVEKETLKKSEKLILNVDGAIAAALLDLFTESNFSDQEIDEFIELGIGNGLFALARSIGIIGHAIDQKRLKQPLYRHPDDDILYI